MARVADITIERARTGHPICIKFNYNKYAGLLQNFLREYNIEIPLLPNDVTMAAIKEAQNHKTLKSYSSAENLLADCLND